MQRYRPARPAAPRDSAAPPGGGAAAAHPVTARSPFAAPAGASLAVNGNKTIAVEFGSSQDAFLRQSLDLSVSGTLAPGVQLTGVLSDRNLPLTAAGSTQDLQALDRVLIELTAPHGSAALGDVALSLGQGEFARLERRVQGARADWSVGRASAARWRRPAPRASTAACSSTARRGSRGPTSCSTATATPASRSWRAARW